MKKFVKLLTGVLAAFVLTVFVLPGTVVRAEGAEQASEKKTYTITFRAGNVGSFHAELAEALPGVEATENYIKFTVEKNTTLNTTYFNGTGGKAELEAFFLNVTSGTEERDYIDSAYRLKGIEDWADGAMDAVAKRNTEYVLDYARLVNPVKYTICFVDAESGEQVAPPTIAYGDAGEEIQCTPLTVLGYTTTEQPVQMILSETDENTVTFRYTYNRETVTQTVVDYIPGETVTNTVFNEITVPGGGVTVLPNPGGAVNIPDENPPLDDGNLDENENGNENVNIPEESTPMSDGEDEWDTVIIGEEETPLAADAEAEMNQNWTVLISIIVVILVLLFAVAFIVFREKKGKAIAAEAENTEEK